VAFSSSSSNLVAGDSNGIWDIFVHNRQTGETTRVSVSSAGVQANGASDEPSISSDGRYVAFRSNASNLVADDSNSKLDIFVHDRQTDETTRVSVSSSGIQGNGDSYFPSISADGRYVAFHSDADNLVAGDSNEKKDVFVHDRQTGLTEMVSLLSSEEQGNGDSYSPSISSDGRYVAFSSEAGNLVVNDTNAKVDIFVHDRQTTMLTRVSVSSTGEEGNGDSYSYVQSISADGRYVLFLSAADNLVAGDSNNFQDIFAHDRQTGQTSRVSVSSSGEQGNGDNHIASISSDGRFVAFSSSASNLVAADSNSAWDIFVHDRITDETTCVSATATGVIGDSYSYIPSISADGRYVAFSSKASNLVLSDSNNKEDIFLNDRLFVFLPGVMMLLSQD
jgi:Tol biopolymer transport system component